jgi:hypothetical protein
VNGGELVRFLQIVLQHTLSNDDGKTNDFCVKGKTKAPQHQPTVIFPNSFTLFAVLFGYLLLCQEVSRRLLQLSCHAVICPSDGQSASSASLTHNDWFNSVDSRTLSTKVRIKDTRSTRSLVHSPPLTLVQLCSCVAHRFGSIHTRTFFPHSIHRPPTMGASGVDRINARRAASTDDPHAAAPVAFLHAFSPSSLFASRHRCVVVLRGLTLLVLAVIVAQRAAADAGTDSAWTGCPAIGMGAAKQAAHTGDQFLAFNDAHMIVTQAVPTSEALGSDYWLCLWHSPVPGVRNNRIAVVWKDDANSSWIENTTASNFADSMVNMSAWNIDLSQVMEVDADGSGLAGTQWSQHCIVVHSYTHPSALVLLRGNTSEGGFIDDISVRPITGLPATDDKSSTGLLATDDSSSSTGATSKSDGNSATTSATAAIHNESETTLAPCSSTGPRYDTGVTNSASSFQSSSTAVGLAPDRTGAVSSTAMSSSNQVAGSTGSADSSAAESSSTGSEDTDEPSCSICSTASTVRVSIMVQLGLILFAGAAATRGIPITISTGALLFISIIVLSLSSICATGAITVLSAGVQLGEELVIDGGFEVTRVADGSHTCALFNTRQNRRNLDSWKELVGGAGRTERNLTVINPIAVRIWNDGNSLTQEVFLTDAGITVQTQLPVPCQAQLPSTLTTGFLPSCAAAPSTVQVTFVSSTLLDSTANPLPPLMLPFEAALGFSMGISPTTDAIGGEFMMLLQGNHGANGSTTLIPPHNISCSSSCYTDTYSGLLTAPVEAADVGLHALCAAQWIGASNYISGAWLELSYTRTSFSLWLVCSNGTDVVIPHYIALPEPLYRGAFLAPPSFAVTTSTLQCAAVASSNTCWNSASIRSQLPSFNMGVPVLNYYGTAAPLQLQLTSPESVQSWRIVSPTVVSLSTHLVTADPNAALATTLFLDLQQLKFIAASWQYQNQQVNTDFPLPLEVTIALQAWNASMHSSPNNSSLSAALSSTGTAIRRLLDANQNAECVVEYLSVDTKTVVCKVIEEIKDIQNAVCLAGCLFAAAESGEALLPSCMVGCKRVIKVATTICTILDIVDVIKAIKCLNKKKDPPPDPNPPKPPLDCNKNLPIGWYNPCCCDSVCC